METSTLGRRRNGDEVVKKKKRKEKGSERKEKEKEREEEEEEKGTTCQEKHEGICIQFSV